MATKNSNNRRPIIGKETGVALGVVLAVLAIALVVGQTYGQVKANNAVILQLPDRYMPRKELGAELKAIAQQQADMAEDLREIKDALGIRKPRREADGQ